MMLDSFSPARQAVLSLFAALVVSMLFVTAAVGPLPLA